MSGQLRNLPGGELAEDGRRKRLGLALERLDFVTDVNVGIISDKTQLRNLGLQFGNRLLKV
jgi:hypothetical protein